MFGRKKFYKNFKSSFSFIKINSCFIRLVYLNLNKRGYRDVR